MKKRIIFLAAVLTALVLCAGALAEPDAEDLYGQVISLLFRTSNVTLKVKADFSLNGQWVKTLDGTWQQDRDRSFRQVLLSAPKSDGTELHNGYTLVAAGTEFNVMEVYHAGTYKTGTMAERTSILHNTAETEQLIRLGEGIVSLANVLPGGMGVTNNGDGTVRIEMNGNAPEIVNGVLTQAAQFAVKRYFSIDPDQLEADSEASVYYYNTVIEGLMYCMRGITLESLTATVTQDANGWIQKADGGIRMTIDTCQDGPFDLEVRFEAEVSDRGTTMVRKFNPDDYGVVLRGEEEAAAQGSNIEYMSGEQIAELERKAKECWRLTGREIGEIVADRAEYTDDGLNKLVFIMEDGTAFCTAFDETNTAVTLFTEPQVWEDILLDYVFDPEVDAALDLELQAMMNDFLWAVDPDKAEWLQNTGKALRADRMSEIDGVTYITYCEDPMDDDGQGVVFTMRVGPTPWIEFYAAVSNG